jgi:hypothetical protein
MDGQLTAITLVGIGIGIKTVGALVTRRLGPSYQERWANFTDTFRIKIARICCALAAALFWGFLFGAAGKYIMLSWFSVVMTDVAWLSVISTPVAIGIFVWLYPKTAEFIC